MGKRDSIKRKYVHLDNIELMYLSRKKIYNFANNSKYNISIGIEVGENNNSDSISFYLDDELIKEVNIEKQVLQNINTTLEIEANEKQRLYILNSSDDESIIKSLYGGIRDMADEILQISLSNINNKSITVTSNKPFTGEEKIELYDSVSNAKIDNINIVEDSVNPNEFTKVIIVGGEYDPGLTNPGKYNVVVDFSGDIVNTPFDLGYYPALIKDDVDVKVYGDRIIYVSFKYPVNDLDGTVIIPSKVDPTKVVEVLENMYMLYYDTDTNISNGAIPMWGGYFVIDELVDITHSSDFRSLEIQYNKRSIPTGDNYLLINYTRQQTINQNYLMDYYVPGRPFPTVKKMATTIKDAVAAKPISVVTVGRTEVIVKFDKPVCLLKNQEEDILFMNDSATPLNTIARERVGGNFDTIKYTLSNSTPLDLGTITLKVESITDACGYQTIVEEFSVIVTDVPARIISVNQVDEENENVTTLSVLFSKQMKQGGDGDVENKTYYKIISATDPNFEAIFTSDPFVYDDATKTMIIKTELLEEGEYILIADGVKDVFGTDMPIQNILFSVQDYTVPKVVQIVNRRETNKIVIKFNEKMALFGDHSATEPTNYKYVDKNSLPHVGNILPANTVTASMKAGKWIRLLAPNNFIPAIPLEPVVVGEPNPQDNYFIHIGYPKAKEIKFITNASGNIYPLCDVKTIDIVYDAYNIAKTGCELVIMSDKEIIFNYVGPEELVSVDASDFVILKGVEELIPDSATILDDKNIKLSFNSATFNATETDLELKVVTSTSKTKDIFGDSILETQTVNIPIKNGIKAALIGVSLTGNYDNQSEVEIVYSFSKALGYFNPTDFFIIGLDNVLVTGTTVQVTDKMYKVKYTVTKQILPGEISVGMVNLPTTIDVDGNPIEILVAPLLVEIVIATDVKWAPISGTLGIANNYIKMTFGKDINPSSIIADVGLVTTGVSNLTPWDGSLINILPNKFATAVDPSNTRILNIDVTDTNIGDFVLTLPTGVTATVITLTKSFTLELVNNIVTLKFATDETAVSANLSGAIMTYKPGISIITADNKYVIDNSRIPVNLL